MPRIVVCTEEVLKATSEPKLMLVFWCYSVCVCGIV